MDPRSTRPPSAGSHRIRRGPLRRTAVGALTVAAVSAFAVGAPPPSSAQPAPSQEAAVHTRATTDQVQQRLDALVAADDHYYPAALATLQRADGYAHDYVAGTGDLATGSPVPLDGEVRIGSNTKTFTAVTVLQLVGEGRIGLDRPVDTYLPGLLRGHGIDGRVITVRQLLQHTSGLPNYTYFLADGLLPHLHTYLEPRKLLDYALAKPADFAPGTSWQYSNTNFLVAGLIVEAVTHRPLSEQITERVINRIGLQHTYFPTVGDQTVHGRHPHAYHKDDPAKPLADVTEQDPSFGWAAGQMISTPSELNRFFTALLGGKLLAPAQLEQMRTTVPAPGLGKGVRYGLGLISTPLSCGGVSWGHGGSITGYSTTNAATDDGRAATIATTRLPQTQEQVSILQRDLDEALCR